MSISINFNIYKWIYFLKTILQLHAWYQVSLHWVFLPYVLHFISYASNCLNYALLIPYIPSLLVT